MTEKFSYKNHFKDYFKTRGLKQIAQWLIIALVTVVMFSIFTVADAYAAEFSSNHCGDIQGITTAVTPPSPNGNSGRLDFDVTPTGTYQNMNVGGQAPRICRPASGTPDTWTTYQLDGWLWDNNLGWISLYCGSDGMNRGVACDGTAGAEYGVKVDIATGELSGWAWGDNIGWISFGCQSNDNDGSACGAQDYASTMEMTVGSDMGKIVNVAGDSFSSWAWADSVGWFNLDGIDAEILKLLIVQSPTETDWGVWTKAEIKTNADENAFEAATNGDKTKYPIASFAGTDGYDIFVHVADINGDPIDEAIATLDIQTNWTDTVKLDQTVDQNIDKSNTNVGATVLKPNADTNNPQLTFKAGENSTGGIGNNYHALAYSLAPTDIANCYDGDGDGSCLGGEGDFIYRNFGVQTQNNDAIYENATVTVTVAPETVTIVASPLGYPGGKNLGFRPPVDIPTFNFLTIPGDIDSGINLIRAIRNKLDNLHIVGDVDSAYSGSYEVDIDLEQGNPDVNYVFIPEEDSDPETEGVQSLPTISSGFNSYNEIHYSIPYAPEETLTQNITGARAKSTITLPKRCGYAFCGIRYHNNGLPRDLTSEVRNQVAKIFGSVFSIGARDVSAETQITTSGDITAYDIRNQYYNNVKNLTGSVPIIAGGEWTISSGTGADQLAAYSFSNGQVYYFKNADIIIEDMSKFNQDENKPVTIIVEGGDLYLKDDIYNTDTHWGFIVLESEDPLATIENRGGRMYLHNNVRDLEDVHIFLDGPLFSYTDGVCYTWTEQYGPAGNTAYALREPNFISPTWPCDSAGSFKEPVQNLNYQLYFKGELTSYNCLGCAAAAQPFRGDGKAIGGPSSTNYAIARLYDLNYLRYYDPTPAPANPFDGGAAAKSEIVKDKKAADGSFDDTFPLYFEYSAPPNDLKGFTIVSFD